jgi:FecR protein
VLDNTKTVCARILAAGLLVLCSAMQVEAEDAAPWRVSKSSGEVWMTTSGVQKASLTDDTLLKPGDSIRTGRSGRVLLIRGEETILISPNSAVALPDKPQDGLSTTIIEQAGSILIKAEKRNVKHFQVETPYLAAVVKGTQFRVDVGQKGSRVEVLEGKVEVSDFKTGQFALVLPGQSAQVQALGNHGLSLSGSGKFNPIERGAPRPSSIQRVPVPKGGFAMPSETNGRTVHAIGHIGDAASNSFASADSGRAHNPLRISAPLGEVRLNFVKATKGLAHGVVMSPAEQHSAKQADWKNDNSSPGRADNSDGRSNGEVKAAGLDLGNASANGTGNGNGLALGIGNGNGNGNGNGLALGVGNGNGNGLALGVGNGNGNGLALGVGNGNGNGLALGNGNGNGVAVGWARSR